MPTNGVNRKHRRNLLNPSLQPVGGVRCDHICYLGPSSPASGEFVQENVLKHGTCVGGTRSPVVLVVEEILNPRQGDVAVTAQVVPLGRGVRKHFYSVSLFTVSWCGPTRAGGLDITPVEPPHPVTDLSRHSELDPIAVNIVVVQTLSPPQQDEHLSSEQTPRPSPADRPQEHHDALALSMVSATGTDRTFA